MALIKRVRIGQSAGSSSPFRVAVTGIDVDGNLAQFDNLLFDANQPPLRLAGSGWASISVIDRYTDPTNAPKARLNRAVPAPSTPSGTANMFMCTWREPNLFIASVLDPVGITRTVKCAPGDAQGGQGAGGAISSGWMNSLQFCATIKLPSGQVGGCVSNTIWTYVILQNFL